MAWLLRGKNARSTLHSNCVSTAAASASAATAVKLNGTAGAQFADTGDCHKPCSSILAHDNSFWSENTQVVLPTKGSKPLGWLPLRSWRRLRSERSTDSLTNSVSVRSAVRRIPLLFRRNGHCDTNPQSMADSYTPSNTGTSSDGGNDSSKVEASSSSSSSGLSCVVGVQNTIGPLLAGPHAAVASQNFGSYVLQVGTQCGISASSSSSFQHGMEACSSTVTAGVSATTSGKGIVYRPETLVAVDILADGVNDQHAAGTDAAACEMQYNQQTTKDSDEIGQYDYCLHNRLSLNGLNSKRQKWKHPLAPIRRMTHEMRASCEAMDDQQQQLILELAVGAAAAAKRSQHHQHLAAARVAVATEPTAGTAGNSVTLQSGSAAAAAPQYRVPPAGNPALGTAFTLPAALPAAGAVACVIPNAIPMPHGTGRYSGSDGAGWNGPRWQHWLHQQHQLTRLPMMQQLVDQQQHKHHLQHVQQQISVAGQQQDSQPCNEASVGAWAELTCLQAGQQQHQANQRRVSLSCSTGRSSKSGIYLGPLGSKRAFIRQLHVLRKHPDALEELVESLKSWQASPEAAAAARLASRVKLLSDANES